MDLTDWLTNLTVTDFEEKALLVLLGAGATWLGTKVNSTSQQKRERLARETERRHIFERDALVDVQDALDELYRVVEDLVLSRFPPGDPPGTSKCRWSRPSTGGRRPGSRPSRSRCSTSASGR